MLTQTVKISNVTNLSDARYCAGMGVEMLGFSIDEEEPNFITPKKFEEICSWLSGIILVAETAQIKPDKILENLSNYPVHAVQVEDPGLLTYLKSEVELPLILRISVDTYEANEINSIFNRYGDDAAHFLLDSDQSAELSDEWIAVLGELSAQYSVLIGFGIENDSSVLSLTSRFPKVGIALRGSEEIRPGFKDFGNMMDILEALEEQ